jgi:hypothetical protein
MEGLRIPRTWPSNPLHTAHLKPPCPCPPARVCDLMRSSRRQCRDMVSNTARVPHMTDSLNRWHPIAERLLQQFAEVETQGGWLSRVVPWVKQREWG